MSRNLPNKPNGSATYDALSGALAVSAGTDRVVGYNNTSQLLTDLGTQAAFTSNSTYPRLSGALAVKTGTDTYVRYNAGTQLLSNDASITADSTYAQLSGTLATSAQTDNLIAYNSGTQKITDLGNIPQQRFYAYSTNSTAIPVGSAAAVRIFFDVVVDNPLTLFGIGSSLCTVQADGFYIFGACAQITQLGYIYLCLNSGLIASAIAISNVGSLPTISCGVWMVAGDSIRVMAYCASVAGNLSPFNKAIHFWGKRIA